MDLAWLIPVIHRQLKYVRNESKKAWAARTGKIIVTKKRKVGAGAESTDVSEDESISAGKPGKKPDHKADAVDSDASMQEGGTAAAAASGGSGSKKSSKKKKAEEKKDWADPGYAPHLRRGDVGNLDDHDPLCVHGKMSTKEWLEDLDTAFHVKAIVSLHKSIHLLWIQRTCCWLTPVRLLCVVLL